MNLEKGKIITLENDKKYLILNNFTYNNEQYLYISSLDIRHICFVKVKNINNEIDIKVVKDENLIKQFSQNYILNYSNQKTSFEDLIKLISANNKPNKLSYLLGLIIYNLGDDYINLAIDYLK